MMGDTIKDLANSVYDKATGLAGVLAHKVDLHQEHLEGGKVVLGYWNVRGLAGYIRLMLEYCNESYTDRIYSDFPESIEKAKEMHAKREGCEWFAEKQQTGMKFPNLPYLYIDGYKISQSRAIMRYLARKHRLEGKTEQAKLDIDMLDEALKDFLMWHVQLVCFTPKPFYRIARQSYLDTLPENLGYLSKFLASDNRKFVAGDYVTYCDFLMYEYLDIQRLYAPEAVSKFQNLTAYMERLEELPRVKAFMQSERFKRTPVFAPFAAWNGSTRRESFLAGSPSDSSSGDLMTVVSGSPLADHDLQSATPLSLSASKVKSSDTAASD